MILVMGPVDELVTAFFLAHLTATRREYVFVDERHLGTQVHLELDWRPGPPGAGKLTGAVRFPTWSVPLEQVSGIFSRLGTGGIEPPQTPGSLAQRAHAAALLDLFQGPVANRATAMLSNGSKPCQYAAILAAGLRVPDTLAGGAPWHWERFARGLEGDPVIKSVSDERSLVKQVSWEEARAAMRPGHPLPPHQFQQRIPGTNVRAHVVGAREVLACRAESLALDYRHPDMTGHTVRLRAMELPAPVADACRQLSRALGLELTGIDLIEPPGGSNSPADWVCLEVNTCPGFMWFEQHSGLPIARALADHLHPPLSSSC
ncbi:alpha-L-glutamate ligase [Corallococcus interemptor]|uniref:Alpha-L-glutamate ligase n=1 Tax=Corallococcus interemptor TaxID=2316720 RepID=A0A3A8PQU8_9BACT|nr:alpha-L-glutamate ligase [Corallococcus interemptor]RKH58733.1 alpha-L-glutamate ligase [Corallococcus interemptor]